MISDPISVLPPSRPLTHCPFPGWFLLQPLLYRDKCAASEMRSSSVTAPKRAHNPQALVKAGIPVDVRIEGWVLLPSPTLQIPADGTWGPVTPPPAPAPAPPSLPGPSCSVQFAPLLMTIDVGATSAGIDRALSRGVSLAYGLTAAAAPLTPTLPWAWPPQLIIPNTGGGKVAGFRGGRGWGGMSERTDTAQCLHLRHPATPELPQLSTSCPPPPGPGTRFGQRRGLCRCVAMKTPKGDRSGTRQDPRDKAGRLYNRDLLMPQGT